MDAALAWLGRARSPFFLWVHLFDPHLPYDPPAPYVGAFETDAASTQRLTERGVPRLLQRYAARAIDRYDGEILYADAQVGRLFRALRERGLYDRAVIALTADHGESLMQHGDIAHERLFGPQLRVPLIVRMPGGRAGRIRALTSSIDLLPLLSDAEPNVMWDAAVALAKLGDGSGREILLALMSREYYAQFGEVDAQERARAMVVSIQAAAGLGDSEMDAAIARLAKEDPNAQVSNAARKALEYIGGRRAQ